MAISGSPTVNQWKRIDILYANHVKSRDISMIETSNVAFQNADLGNQVATIVQPQQTQGVNHRQYNNWGNRQDYNFRGSRGRGSFNNFGYNPYANRSLPNVYRTNVWSPRDTRDFSNRKDFCYYHQKFGAAARTCPGSSQCAWMSAGPGQIPLDGLKLQPRNQLAIEAPPTTNSYDNKLVMGN